MRRWRIEESYNLGRLTLLDLLRSSSIAEAELREVEALVSFHTAIATIRASPAPHWGGPNDAYPAIPDDRNDRPFARADRCTSYLMLGHRVPLGRLLRRGMGPALPIMVTRTAAGRSR